VIVADEDGIGPRRPFHQAAGRPGGGGAVEEAVDHRQELDSRVVEPLLNPARGRARGGALPAGDVGDAAVPARD
jgi:hypothetical protein